MAYELIWLENVQIDIPPLKPIKPKMHLNKSSTFNSAYEAYFDYMAELLKLKYGNIDKWHIQNT